MKLKCYTAVLKGFLSPGIRVQMQRLRGRECGVFPVPCLDSSGGISVNVEVKHVSLKHTVLFYSIVSNQVTILKENKILFEIEII